MKNHLKTTQSKNLINIKKFSSLTKSKNTSLVNSFLISKAILIFIQLRKTFIKTLMLDYFKLDCYI